MSRPTRALNDYKLQQAIRWMSDRLQENPAAPRGILIDIAGMEFSLSPRQQLFLEHMYLNQGPNFDCDAA